MPLVIHEWNPNNTTRSHEFWVWLNVHNHAGLKIYSKHCKRDLRPWLGRELWRCFQLQRWIQVWESAISIFQSHHWVSMAYTAAPEELIQEGISCMCSTQLWPENLKPADSGWNTSNSCSADSFLNKRPELANLSISGATTAFRHNRIWRWRRTERGRRRSLDPSQLSRITKDMSAHSKREHMRILCHTSWLQ